jgi:hypothetical protein
MSDGILVGSASIRSTRLLRTFKAAMERQGSHPIILPKETAIALHTFSIPIEFVNDPARLALLLIKLNPANLTHRPAKPDQVRS